MTDLLVLAHPGRNSLQTSLFRETEEKLRTRGNNVVSIDLYETDFPVLLSVEEITRGATTDDTVLRQQQALGRADRILLFYPDWWGMPPAVLKGWLDRVLAVDVAFRWEGEDFLEKEWVPLLTGKEIRLFITADGPLDGAWLRALWEERIFGRCGAKVDIHIMDNLRRRRYAEVDRWKKSLIEQL
jgi:NAD(P)H dehydrogenase (quinone)